MDRNTRERDEASGLDANRSCWIDEAPPCAPLPALRTDARADVAVIGGGLTGVSTAWHLAQRFPERRVVLLEAMSLGNGASGRNGGQLLTGAGPSGYFMTLAIPLAIAALATLTVRSTAVAPAPGAAASAAPATR